MSPQDRAATIAAIGEALALGSRAEARTLVRQRYPFEGRAAVRRKYTKLDALRVFHRDGFIDRYSGARLVFPGTLRLLSIEMPRDFPYHPNWKLEATHPAYWQLYPTLDHVVAVAHGGPDDESNWVTTSMLHDSAKAHWPLAELAWELHPPGDPRVWDGLTGWFLDRVRSRPRLLTRSPLREWARAARRSGLFIDPPGRRP
jgi:hypothetical protein